MLDYTFLLIGLLYTLFLPGFVFVEFFLKKLDSLVKIPLYFVFSVVVSTYITYFSSLVFGFSKTTLLVLFIIFLIMSFPFIKNIRYLKINKHKWVYITALGIYFLFFFVLKNSIFRLDGNSYIMSGPNWQDTAMHLSIVESISQGNFPPQAPYFSGHPLSYYYFSDFHTAIVNKFYGKFFPEIFMIVNPFYASSFFLLVYAFIYKLIKSKKLSLIFGLITLFFGNLGFIAFFKKAIEEKTNYFIQISQDANHLDFNNFLFVPPMVDYFLQNRPMIAGLSIFMAITLLLYIRMKKKHDLRILLAVAILNSGLINFQFFGFVSGLGIFTIFQFYLFFSKKISLKRFLNESILYLLICLLPILFKIYRNIGERDLAEMFFNWFSSGIIFKENFSWLLNFVGLNFGPLIWLFFISGVYSFTRKKNRFVFTIFIYSLILFSIPFLVKFTAFWYDMFKFFFYFIPLAVSLVAWVFKYVFKVNIFSKIFLVLLFVFSVFTSINLLTHTYTNKNYAYSVYEKNAGLWIRENTPERSVFITYPSVHNVATDIAGRLRVISYINWPYSHGFDIGTDNVFSRRDDVDYFYTHISQASLVKDILLKYKADYVYLGKEEKEIYSISKRDLEKSDGLNKVYENQEVSIYEKK